MPWLPRSRRVSVPRWFLSSGAGSRAGPVLPAALGGICPAGPHQVASAAARLMDGRRQADAVRPGRAVPAPRTRSPPPQYALAGRAPRRRCAGRWRCTAHGAAASVPAGRALSTPRSAARTARRAHRPAPSTGAPRSRRPDQDHQPRPDRTLRSPPRDENSPPSRRNRCSIACRGGSGGAVVERANRTGPARHLVDRHRHRLARRGPAREREVHHDVERDYQAHALVDRCGPRRRASGATSRSSSADRELSRDRTSSLCVGSPCERGGKVSRNR
jgi:hypothetical protein